MIQTRTDKLFNLVKNGPAGVRFTAIEQIGDSCSPFVYPPAAVITNILSLLTSPLMEAHDWGAKVLKSVALKLRPTNEVLDSVEWQNSKELLLNFEVDLNEPKLLKAKTKANLNQNENLSARQKNMLRRRQSQTSTEILETDGYPLQKTTEYLMDLLFSEKWEERHGAAMGLKELILVQNFNEQVLCFLCFKLLKVLCLDKFCDFKGDTIIVPVREVCAQTLGILVQKMTKNTVKTVICCLQKITNSGEWTLKLSGLLGLKYVVTMRSDVVEKDVFDLILNFLDDQDDDVKATSAAALMPFVDKIPKDLLISRIMLGLEQTNDLSASTGILMELLSNVCIFQKLNLTKFKSMFRHQLTIVRSSLLKTLKVMEPDEEIIRLCFQNFVLELDPMVLELNFELWQLIFKFCPETLIPKLVELLFCPIGQKLNEDLFFLGTQTPKKRKGIDQIMFDQDLSALKYSEIVYGRYVGAKALSLLDQDLHLSYLNSNLKFQVEMASLCLFYKPLQVKFEKIQYGLQVAALIKITQEPQYLSILYLAITQCECPLISQVYGETLCLFENTEKLMEILQQQPQNMSIKEFCKRANFDKIVYKVEENEGNQLFLLHSFEYMKRKNVELYFLDLFDCICSETSCILVAKLSCYLNNCAFFVEKILVMLTKNREMASKSIYYLLLELKNKAPWYSVIFILPLLSCLTSSRSEVVGMAFALCVQLLALDVDVDEPKLTSLRLEQLCFVEQLLCPQKIEFEIPVQINCELRKYQLQGINWLMFLNKYNIHGILCDDMGLGKTLQTIVAISSHHLNRKGQSLVCCPSTIVGHWVDEIKKYSCNLCALAWQDAKQSTCDVIVCSYESLRKDLHLFEKINFEYCVLDEGHVIKNCKNKVSQAVKKVNAKHRLILTGTPIQNNLTEVWSLFDFLMPGFLGTELEFQKNYVRPVKLDNEPEALKALESLHKQVLPFVLRRLKENVLDDLPEKIIQDLFCDMTPLQQELTNQIEAKKTKSKQNTFAMLRNLRNICNHPALYNSKYIDEESPKLDLLKQILIDGFKNHRFLIFCQSKLMLDFVAKTILDIPDFTFLRLDGSTSSQSRYNIVKKFNSDYSVDGLLLTTSAGGLGLNLTSADAVVFVEHDWNPMKDLQAMDRAHRLGQKKVVHVYRLCSRNSIEEKIMSLQRFKIHMANKVVTQQNSALDSMETHDLLDLFPQHPHAASCLESLADEKSE